MLDQRILGLSEDIDESFLIKLLQGRQYGETSDKLWNQAITHQVIGLYRGQCLANIALLFVPAHGGAEPDATFIRALLNNLFQTGKCTTADEQDI